MKDLQVPYSMLDGLLEWLRNNKSTGNQFSWIFFLHVGYFFLPKRSLSL
jgi:hypothetical protein